MTILIVIIVIAIVGIWLVSLYNRLVKLRNNRENAFADIDVQLKQRHDLIPQLVATVKGYAAHEKETLDRVVSARNGAMTAQTIDDKIKAENLLSAALNGLKVTVEAYPDLKANQNFMQNTDPAEQEQLPFVVSALLVPMFGGRIDLSVLFSASLPFYGRRPDHDAFSGRIYQPDVYTDCTLRYRWGAALVFDSLLCQYPYYRLGNWRYSVGTER